MRTKRTSAYPNWNFMTKNFAFFSFLKWVSQLVITFFSEQPIVRKRKRFRMHRKICSYFFFSSSFAFGSCSSYGNWTFFFSVSKQLLRFQSSFFSFSLFETRQQCNKTLLMTKSDTNEWIMEISIERSTVFSFSFHFVTTFFSAFIAFLSQKVNSISMFKSSKHRHWRRY